MITLCKYLGGSHLYGLNTDKSDIDTRQVVLNDTVETILGLSRFDQQTTNTKDTDDKTIELRSFLLELKSGTPAYVEALWAPDEKFTYIHPVFETVRKVRKSLTDPETIYRSLSGYMGNQINRVFELSPKAKKDSDRAIAIEKYGFDNKAASHIVRLAEAGIHYFNTGIYEVEPISYKAEALGLKTNPQDFDKTELRELFAELDSAVDEAYDNHNLNHRFDEEGANTLLLTSYSKTLVTAMQNILNG